MEVVDELVTPGCPQCAVKHLSAALSYLVEMGAPARATILGCPEGISANELTAKILLAKACINLVEVLDGYRSHFDFAVGLMQQAEEVMLMSVPNGRPEDSRGNHQQIRKLRVQLIEAGPTDDDTIQIVIGTLRAVLFGQLRQAYAFAHYQEALRELPEDFRAPVYGITVEAMQQMIAAVREKYFVGAKEAPYQTQEPSQEETTMATKKPAPKKGTTKCACKGGKTKK